MRHRKQVRLSAAALGLALVGATRAEAQLRPTVGIWISPQEIMALPMSGPAWQSLKAAADKPLGVPDVSNQDDNTDVHVLAKALVYVRTGIPSFRDDVVKACSAAIGTEAGGRTLALGRNLSGYVLAADLVVLPEDVDKPFSAWLAGCLTERLAGKTLVSTHEDRPNNWGTHAGASRMAVARYLRDDAALARAAQVFKGWLGDRSAYAGFTYGDLGWQADSAQPVGINPKGATKSDRDVNGVLPDDQRRSGPFTWPPPKEKYVYEALQGAIVQAVILERAGYDPFNWQDQALRRAYQWLHGVCHYDAVGDDTWQPHVINHFYKTSFPAPVPARPGKNVGWTDWTHAGRAAE